MTALASLLADEQQHQNWLDYMSTMSCIIANATSRSKKRIPTLQELTKRSSAEPQQTGQEIFDGVIRAALGGDKE